MSPGNLLEIIPADLLDTVLKIVPEMTYNVLSGTSLLLLHYYYYYYYYYYSDLYAAVQEPCQLILL